MTSTFMSNYFVVVLNATHNALKYVTAHVIIIFPWYKQAFGLMVSKTILFKNFEGER